MRFSRQVDPAAQDAILGKQFQNQIVGYVNVGRFAGQRYPAEWSAAFAKQRTNICGHESGEVVGVLDAALKGEGADVVSVVEGDRAHLLQAQHAFDVPRHGIERFFLIRLRIALAQLERRFEGHAVRYISVQRIVRRSLVGQNVRDDAALGQLRNHVRAISD